jgi:hypothetical protein
MTNYQETEFKRGDRVKHVYLKNHFATVVSVDNGTVYVNLDKPDELFPLSIHRNIPSSPDVWELVEEKLK